MFVPVIEAKSANTYAIVDGTMAEKTNTSRYTDYDVMYSFDAYWFISSGSTKGALGFGRLCLTFNNAYAEELDNRENYFGMSVDEVMYAAETLPPRLEDGRRYGGVRPKKVSTDMIALFGNQKAWSAGVPDEVFRNLVETWFNMPQQPQGTTNWLKVQKNRR